MKRSFLIGWIILSIAFSYGCTKQQLVSENHPTGDGVTAQNNDYYSRQPFKFTITTDLDVDWKEDIKIIVSINKPYERIPVLYDLDCESDGEYEFTGLTDNPG